ncbi:MAG: glycosyltransferase family 4 protein [Pseudomonadota bacterium]
MAALYWIQPGPLDKRTGGFVYNKQIITGLRARGIAIELTELPERYPQPSQDDRREAENLLSGLPDGALVVIDGLAFAVLADEMAPHAERLRIVELCHHPLHLETGMSEAEASALFEAEKSALRHAKAVLTTSHATSRDLEPFDIKPKIPITAILPGVDKGELATGAQGRGVELVCVASLTARKGHRFLFEALAGLRDRDWHLTCAGGAQHEPQTAAAIAEQIDRLSLRDRISLAGELSGQSLDRGYRDAHVFVLPSLHEGYGMVLVEALARGLPIISTTAGAIPDVVPEDAGLLVAPANATALRKALADLIDHPEKRNRLAEGARRARDGLRPWADAVSEFDAALQRIGGT